MSLEPDIVGEEEREGLAQPYLQHVIKVRRRTGESQMGRKVVCFDNQTHFNVDSFPATTNET